MRATRIYALMILWHFGPKFAHLRCVLDPPVIVARVDYVYRVTFVQLLEGNRCHCLRFAGYACFEGEAFDVEP